MIRRAIQKTNSLSNNYLSHIFAAAHNIYSRRHAFCIVVGAFKTQAETAVGTKHVDRVAGSGNAQHAFNTECLESTLLNIGHRISTAKLYKAVV